MEWMDWYNGLSKPDWTPEPATIGLVWSVLYVIIFVTFGFVFQQKFQGKIGWSVTTPFVINLIANILFMPLFSGTRILWLATVDILIVWVTIIWCCLVIWNRHRWVAIAQLPYLMWVSIATVLQFLITVSNWGRP